MNKVAAIISTAVVLVAVITGLLISGSPGEQRLLRLDQQRVNDLRSISAYIDLYWQRNEQLPAELHDLIDGTRIPFIPRDPITDQSYEFQAEDQRNYQLCAVFDRPAEQVALQTFWDHPAGRHCFPFSATPNRLNRVVPAIAPLGALNFNQ